MSGPVPQKAGSAHISAWFFQLDHSLAVTRPTFRLVNVMNRRAGRDEDLQDGPVRETSSLGRHNAPPPGSRRQRRRHQAAGTCRGDAEEMCRLRRHLEPGGALCARPPRAWWPLYAPAPPNSRERTVHCTSRLTASLCFPQIYLRILHEQGKHAAALEMVKVRAQGTYAVAACRDSPQKLDVLVRGMHGSAFFFSRRVLSPPGACRSNPTPSAWRVT